MSRRPLPPPLQVPLGKRKEHKGGKSEREGWGSGSKRTSIVKDSASCPEGKLPSQAGEQPIQPERRRSWSLKDSTPALETASPLKSWVTLGRPICLSEPQISHQKKENSVIGKIKSYSEWRVPSTDPASSGSANKY